MSALLRVAARDIRRNARRSAVTLAAIAIGTAALICFGQFVAQTTLNFQTGVVRSGGHLAVFRAGYSDFGAGKPDAYGIADYPYLIARIRRDPVLGPRITVITPTIRFLGIAGNFDRDLSTTVSAIGLVPRDFGRMRAWDTYGVRAEQPLLPVGLSESDPTLGVVGSGVARLLGLCAALKVTCPETPAAKSDPVVEQAPSYLRDLSTAMAPAKTSSAPMIDVLAASTGGAPNVVRLKVETAERQGIKELDDAYVRMNFDQARQLLFGSGAPQATAIVIQLADTGTMADSKARLENLLQASPGAFEVRDLNELNPFYVQSVRFLSAVFLFLATIIGTIVLFTVVNTMGMSVLERTSEIGTARALGARRGRIRAQFLAEGLMLGTGGATLGLVLIAAITIAVNAIGLELVLPGTSDPVPLRLYAAKEIVPLVLAVWVGLVAVAVIAAFAPANRAARLPIVDALRHI